MKGAEIEEEKDEWIEGLMSANRKRAFKMYHNTSLEPDADTTEQITNLKVHRHY
jgi:hypothetical protein